MKKIVVFRSKSPINNSHFLQRLSDLEYQIISYPILEVKKTYYKKLNIKKNSIIFTTSFNSIHFLSELMQQRDIQLYTMGEASSILAKKLNFKNIIECNGDSANMVTVFLEKNKKSLTKKKGDIIYAGAKDISYDVPKRLEEYGFNVKRYILYETKKIEELSLDFIELVRNKEVKWVVLLSKKGAENFYSLSKKIFSNEEISKIKFVCFSKKISDVFKNKSYKTFFPLFSNVNSIIKIILNSEKNYGT